VADQYQGELNNKLRYIKQAIIETPGLALQVAAGVAAAERQLNEINITLNGDASRSRREFESLPGINSRIGYIVYSLWNTTSAPTQTQQDAYQLASKQLGPVCRNLKAVGVQISELEAQLEKSGAPATPGRIPEWNEEGWK
jgi:hypothetical protein